MRATMLATGLALGLGLQAQAIGIGDWGTYGAASEAPYDRALEAVYEGRFEEAIEALEQVVADSPGHADAHNYLAFSYRKTGRFEEAFEHYRTALDLEPDHKGALEYLGELYLQLDRPEEAEALLVRLEELCPDGCLERDELREAITDWRAAEPEG
jgi:Flp pilus assembly protein TadD